MVEFEALGAVGCQQQQTALPPPGVFLGDRSACERRDQPVFVLADVLVLIDEYPPETSRQPCPRFLGLVRLEIVPFQQGA